MIGLVRAFVRHWRVRSQLDFARAGRRACAVAAMVAALGLGCASLAGAEPDAPVRSAAASPQTSPETTNQSGAAIETQHPAIPGHPGAAESTVALSDPEKIFARAKAMWRAREAAPYVSYSLLERYVWRDRQHDNWWQANYRARDRALSLRRTVVAAQEAARLKGAAIGLDIHWHSAPVRADALDTNASADAFPILDPLIEPDASFGFARRNDAGALSANVLQRTAAAAPASEPALATAPGAASTPAAQLSGESLREVGRVEVVARDYRIALAGIESLRYGDAYHLTLQPLHDPKRYRLRDLWVSTDTFATQQLAVEGLFAGKPYDEALWTVTYVPFGGAWYVSQIKTSDTLRFGMDRYVDGLEYDFVQYSFPDDVPDMTFTRYTF